MTFEERLK
jgi:ribosomal RNA-processing protein 36